MLENVKVSFIEYTSTRHPPASPSMASGQARAVYRRILSVLHEHCSQLTTLCYNTLTSLYTTVYH